MITVIPIGEPVLIGGNVPAVVTGITIRSGDHVTYEVSWFDGATHYCQWLESLEVSTREKRRTSIGFLSVLNP